MCMSPDPIKRTNILGVGVSSIDLPRAVEQIGSWVKHGEKHYVCVSNVHTVIECQRDPALKRIHNQAGLVTPDGMPLVWVSRLRGNSLVRRVYGPDLLLAVCSASVKQGYRHYFYGGADGVAERLAEHLTNLYPGLRIVGWSSPPFRPLSEEEDEFAVAHINQSGADIVWVGLGAPRQERWMADHRAKLEAPVVLGIGAAFDFHSGTKKQAPIWMQQNGLEWFFRLCSEPRRLWRRYFFTNSLFLWLMFLQWTGLKHYAIDL